MRTAGLQAASLILSKCGVPMPPQSGVSAVDIPVNFLYQTVVPSASTQQQELEIDGDTSFFLSSLSGLQPPVNLQAYVQIVFPNGRTLQQALRRWTQDPGFGSSRCILDGEVECPPGSKIRIAGSTAFATPQTTCAFTVLFEGCYRFYLNDAGQVIPSKDLASSLPRIFATRNQNPDAPRWTGDVFPGAEGWQKYIYQSPVNIFALPGAAAGVNTFIEVETDAGYEFQVLRRFVRYSVDAGSSATPYIRSRQSDGYMLDDDFVSVAGVTGMFLPKWWRIPPGRAIVTDVLVVDNAGVGNLNIQVFFEGLRRRPQ